MKSNWIKAKTKRRFKATKKSKHDFLVADNLLNQRFSAKMANKIWVSDISVP
jgi:transposase InsO family protein